MDGREVKNQRSIQIDMHDREGVGLWEYIYIYIGWAGVGWGVSLSVLSVVFIYSAFNENAKQIRILSSPIHKKHM